MSGLVFASLPRLPRAVIVIGAIAVVLAAGCAQGTEPDMLPVPPVSVRVGEPVRITLDLAAGSPGNFIFTFDAPQLPALRATISGNEFLWTPLANHAEPDNNVHEFTFTLQSRSGDVLDRERTLITVLPSADSAPVFIGLNGGRDFDVPGIVRFDIEVRDDDSSMVQIRERQALPPGATLTAVDGKRARFEWEPQPAQYEQELVWPIALEAHDGNHDPVPLDFVIRLRREARPGCPGIAPAVVIADPAEGARISSADGFYVRVTVTDDLGVRTAPVLYWTATPPFDLEHPDLGAFADVEFEQENAGAVWTARIPSIDDLAEGETQPLYVVASAIDNDDGAGTDCDHRTDTAVRSFIAIGSEESPALADCEACTSSSECASGVCVPSEGGAKCLPACSTTTLCLDGTCALRTNSEGAQIDACGDVGVVCGGAPPVCMNDALEPNDAIAIASPFGGPGSAMVCPGDKDFYRLESMEADRITVTLRFTSAEGDLDLEVTSSIGAVLGRGAGGGDVETVTLCAPAGALYARVFGFEDHQNDYAIEVARLPGGCMCMDDAFEGDDTAFTARVPEADSTFSGVICSGDDDYIAIDMAGAGYIESTIVFDHATGDLDLQLLDPTGAILDTSAGVVDVEVVDAFVTMPGRYYARVYGFRGAGGAYLGEMLQDMGL